MARARESPVTQNLDVERHTMKCNEPEGLGEEGAVPAVTHYYPLIGYLWAGA